VTLALETIGLSKQFGALTVADLIDFKLEAGARHALIGPNGAGKTTFINLLTGRLTPSSGQVKMMGQEISSLNESQRVKLGLGRTFQINSLFNKMTVLDNVSLGI
jgi:branched-chain amino acid transport system ATP-binding protein